MFVSILDRWARDMARPKINGGCVGVGGDTSSVTLTLTRIRGRPSWHPLRSWVSSFFLRFQSDGQKWVKTVQKSEKGVFFLNPKEILHIFKKKGFFSLFQFFRIFSKSFCPAPLGRPYRPRPQYSSKMAKSGSKRSRNPKKVVFPESWGDSTCLKKSDFFSFSTFSGFFLSLFVLPP